jgi:hypothetical protein
MGKSSKPSKRSRKSRMDDDEEEETFDDIPPVRIEEEDKHESQQEDRDGDAGSEDESRGQSSQHSEEEEEPEEPVRSRAKAPKRKRASLEDEKSVQKEENDAIVSDDDDPRSPVVQNDAPTQRDIIRMQMAERKAALAAKKAMTDAAASGAPLGGNRWDAGGQLRDVKTPELLEKMKRTHWDHYYPKDNSEEEWERIMRENVLKELGKLSIHDDMTSLAVVSASNQKDTMPPFILTPMLRVEWSFLTGIGKWDKKRKGITGLRYQIIFSLGRNKEEDHQRGFTARATEFFKRLRLMVEMILVMMFDNANTQPSLKATMEVDVLREMRANPPPGMVLDNGCLKYQAVTDSGKKVMKTVDRSHKLVRAAMLDRWFKGAKTPFLPTQDSNNNAVDTWRDDTCNKIFLKRNVFAPSKDTKKDGGTVKEPNITDEELPKKSDMEIVAEARARGFDWNKPHYTDALNDKPLLLPCFDIKTDDPPKALLVQNGMACCRISLMPRSSEGARYGVNGHWSNPLQTKEAGEPDPFLNQNPVYDQGETLEQLSSAVGRVTEQHSTDVKSDDLLSRVRNSTTGDVVA